jgi:hypothetical protein
VFRDMCLGICVYGYVFRGMCLGVCRYLCMIICSRLRV